MQINAYIDREDKRKIIKLDENSSVSELLKSLNINPVTVLVARNNELLLESEKLNDNDEIKIYSVISGG